MDLSHQVIGVRVSGFESSPPVDVHRLLYLLRQGLDLQLALSELPCKVVSLGLEVGDGTVLMFVGLDLVHGGGNVVLLKADLHYFLPVLRLALLQG